MIILPRELLFLIVDLELAHSLQNFPKTQVHADTAFNTRSPPGSALGTRMGTHSPPQQPGPVVLNGMRFGPPRDIWQSLETFLLVTPRVVWCYCLLVVRGPGMLLTSDCAQDSPHSKE